MQNEIIPSILVDDLEEFQEQITIAEDFADAVHWDVMDGQFVENMTFQDFTAVKQVDTVLTLYAHLMVEHPEELFEAIAKAGVDRVIIHAQAVDDLSEVVEKMKNYSFDRGIALSPEIEVSEIEEVLDDLDHVLVMTVVPGASGQEFMEDQLYKIEELRELKPDLSIGVDGGINKDTIKLAKDAGANVFAVNSAIFEAPDPANAYEVLKMMVQ